MTSSAQAVAAIDELAAQLQAHVEDGRFVPNYFNRLFGLRTVLGDARERFAAEHAGGSADAPPPATVLDHAASAIALGEELAPTDAAVDRYGRAVERVAATLAPRTAVAASQPTHAKRTIIEACPMCNDHHAGRRSVHCILPPFLLTNIARNAGPELRDRALRTLLIDPGIRIRRATASGRAIAGGLAGESRAVTPTPRRTIRDAEGEPELPGRTVARREGDPPTGDPAVDEAYDGLGATFDLFWEAYRRDSIDDAGLPLEATVHFDRDYDNAFWDGERMVFGDGDGELFNRFTLALDIIGHELAHGLIEREAGLIYYGQPGALNEHIADVFGSLVKQRARGQNVVDADWLIGAGLFTPAVSGRGLRSMSEPGTAYDDPVLGRDPQPGHMDDYVRTGEDNGGVHINSGIPNRAFHLAALAIGGEAWERAGRVWYYALLDPRTLSDTGFAAFARTTVDVAARLYGPDGPEALAIGEAWTAVGLDT